MDINIEEKIKNFKSLTNCYDDDIALNMLSITNWDEVEAASIYSSNTNNNNNNKNDIYNYSNFDSNNSIKDKNNKESKDSELEEGYCTNREIMETILGLPAVKNYNSFLKLIGNKIGILMLYKKENIDLITDCMFNLRDNDVIMEIIKANYVIYISEINSPDIKAFMQNQKMSYIAPTTLFMHDPYFNYLNNEKLVLYKLEGFLEYNLFCEKISDCSSKINTKGHKQENNLSNNYYNDNLQNNNVNNKNNYNNNYLDNNSINNNNNYYSNYIDESKMSGVDLIEKQKKELEQIENQMLMDEKLNKDKEIEKQKEIEAIRKKVSQEKHTREDYKKKLLPEPLSDNKDATIIKFRMPDGTTLERRFLKSMLVEQLYFFIGSRDSFLQEEDSSFDLINQFPFKKYDNLFLTLEEEGLYPRVTIQVREI